MTGTGVGERPRQLGDEAGPVFDVLAAKLRVPRTRPGSVRRASLIDRLTLEVSRPVVSVVAPAGYGKTTLLAQWAERSGQAVAWVSVDEQDNDPKVLLGYVARALDAVQPVGQLVFDALASPASSVFGSVVPRLGSAFAAMTVPVALILDDVHLLRSSECRAALSVLADHVPGRGRLVLAGRDQPPVRVARLRAEGRLTEIGPADLALTREEAAELLRDAQVEAAQGDVTDLYQRTEGWAAGLYLAALAVREGGSLPDAVASFSGGDQFVSQYVESELLARVSPAQREFLTRVAVLGRISGPLCEAALDLPGSAATLAELAGSNMLLVPLDHRREWYRYHHLFRDMLFAELERREPGLIPVLRRHAATWYLHNDLPEEALEYSITAGDVDTVARLLQTLWTAVFSQGRTATLQRWFRWLEDRGGIEKYPLNAMNAAFLAALTGQPVQAERWADAVDRWQYQDGGSPGDAYTEAMAATLRAVMCRRGPEQMRADADEAGRKFAVANFAAATTPLAQGIAQVLRGDPASADAFFSEAVHIDEESPTADVLALALCERSLAAMTRGQWDQAGAFADHAHARLRQHGVEDSFAAALTSAVQARTAEHRGDVPAARQKLVHALRLRHLVTYAQPHLAVQLRITLIRVHRRLDDLAGARTLMREIDEILTGRPQLGVLVGEAGELRAQLATQGHSPLTASSLTAAELRLLPMLSTHLQMNEIAAGMYLSVHIVRAQSKSIYRRLGAASRSQAVARARELGLLEG
jgi:LuxR family transcriptional regulator, maltose regulon positive regulatory protein